MKPFINVHTHKTSDGQLSLINAPYEGLWPKSEYYSYGLHPWDIGILNAVHEFEMIKKYCSERKILAVGEIGIDRAIHASIETQSNLFIEQLGIAEWYGLPVIIHCVRAYSDILEIKKKRKHTTPWILHGFAGNFQTAEQLILAGCFLSFGSKLLINQSVQKSFELPARLKIPAYLLI